MALAPLSGVSSVRTLKRCMGLQEISTVNRKRVSSFLKVPPMPDQHLAAILPLDRRLMLCWTTFWETWACQQQSPGQQLLMFTDFIFMQQRSSIALTLYIPSPMGLPWLAPEQNMGLQCVQISKIDAEHAAEAQMTEHCGRRR